jgi:hypothetical protein
METTANDILLTKSSACLGLKIIRGTLRAIGPPSCMATSQTVALRPKTVPQHPPTLATSNISEMMGRR